VSIPRRTHRRDFLRTAGPAFIVGPELARAARAWDPVPSTEPGTGARPRLLTGCCAYSYRELLKVGKMTMEDVIGKAVELGIDAVDMTGYWFKSTEPPYLASLRHLAYKNGVGFSGAATGASTVQADAGRRAQVLEEIKKWIDVTESLGAPHLRVFAGKLPPGATMQQGIHWTVEALKVAAEYAGKKGITLGVENHEGITQNADASSSFSALIHPIWESIWTSRTSLPPRRLTPTRKSKPRSLTRPTLTSETSSKMGKLSISTACGRFSHARIIKGLCPQNMKVKRVP